MVEGRAIKETSQIIQDTNLSDNKDTHIKVTRKNDARLSYVDFKDTDEMHWSKYQIKESDMRAKTATFTSPNYLDLTTGVYAVLITSTQHEDFGGEIINVEYDKETGLYDYTCQDWSRDYQGKFDVVLSGNVTIHRLLKWLISRNRIPLQGKISNSLLKQYKNELSGLLPSYQYDLQWKRPNWNKKYGGINFTEKKPQLIIRNKSYIEAIRDICYDGYNEVDVYFNKYGVLQIEPIMPDELYNTGLHLTSNELSSSKYSFDTTNILTAITVNGDKTSTGTTYTSESLLNLDLSVFFGRLGGSIDNPNPSNSQKQDKKKSTNTKTSANPYGTKKKLVEVGMDTTWNKKKDAAFLNKVISGLKKAGWTVINNGHGPNKHTESHFNVKNGVHFTLFSGADCGVIKEMTGNNSYTKKQARYKSRTVCGWISPPAKADIRKGGNSEKHIRKAHDDNYRGCPQGGMSNPRKRMIKAKVPYMYAKTADEMVAKFLKGGDELGAL